MLTKKRQRDVEVDLVIVTQLTKLKMSELFKNPFKSSERVHSRIWSVFEAQQQAGDCFLAIMSEIGLR